MKNAGFPIREILRSLFFLFKEFTFTFTLCIKLLIPFEDVASTAYFVGTISTDGTCFPNIRIPHVAVTTNSIKILLCQFSPVRFSHYALFFAILRQFAQSYD